nr:glycosyltransferase family 4 protein [Rhabdothermincola salaria]
MPFSTDGSAVNNVIREVTRAAAADGIDSVVVGSHNRTYEFPHARVETVDHAAHLDHEYLTRPQMLADAALGRVGRARPWAGRLYRPAAEQLGSVDGPVFVHEGFYGAVAPSLVRATGYDGGLFVYLHAQVSKTYSRRELRRLLDPVDAVVCVSGAMRDVLADRLGGGRWADRLAVVNNAVDVDRFTPAVAQPHADGSGPPVVLFVGAMIPAKGPDVLLDALVLLAERGVEVQARFVGSSTHAPGLPLSRFERRLRRRAERLGDRVTLVPYVPNAEVPELYRAADVLVVPSQFADPCPLVVLEGMASGLAVVATPRGGAPEIGADAVDYADGAEGLAAVLAVLATDPERRRAQGERGRRQAEASTWAHRLERLRAVVDATAAGAGSAS